MKILWSALSLVVVAALALVLWNAAGGVDRVEIVRDGVSVDNAPAPEQSPGTARRTPEPSTSSGTAAPPAPPASAPPAPAPPAPLPPAQVPLPVQPAPLDGDRDDELDDGPDDGPDAGPDDDRDDEPGDD